MENPSWTTEEILALPSEPAFGYGDRMRRTRLGELEVLILRTGDAVAAVSTYGAQVLTFRGTDGIERLFCSRDAVLDGSKAIRGGIPICWPWFGPAGDPQHGWARLRSWQVIDDEVDEQVTSLILRLTVEGGEAELAIALTTDHLSVRLLHRADPVDLAAPVTAALHAYWTVTHAEGSRVEGLPGDQVFPAGGIDEPIVLGELARRDIAVHSEDRTHRFTADGSDAVIWNPGADLGDVPAGGWDSFVCVEPARISRPLHIGESLGLRIS